MSQTVVGVADVPQPEALTLAGPNSAGKTTASAAIMPAGTQFFNADLIADGLVAGGHRLTGLDDLASLLGEMLAETGGPLTAAERKAADRALGR